MIQVTPGHLPSSSFFASPRRVWKSLAKLLFWFAAKIGRPFGGIRPQRIVHWLAREAYGDFVPVRKDFAVHRDCYGNRLLLHPHYFIDYQIIAFGIYEPALNRLFRGLVKPGATCLDVGANIGDTTLNLIQLVGKHGSVISFEPVPHLFEKLQENVNLNPLSSVVALHRLALSNLTGYAKIEIASEGYTNQGMASMHHEGSLRFSHSIDIETVTLDEFVQQQNITRLDLIKVDIQGAEPWFIEGGKETLSRLKPDMVIEVSPSDLKLFGFNASNLLRSVEDLGYDCYRVTKRGRISDKIQIADICEDFEADEIYCRFRKFPKLGK